MLSPKSMSAAPMSVVGSVPYGSTGNASGSADGSGRSWPATVTMRPPDRYVSRDAAPPHRAGRPVRRSCADRRDARRGPLKVPQSQFPDTLSCRRRPEPFVGPVRSGRSRRKTGRLRDVEEYVQPAIRTHVDVTRSTEVELRRRRTIAQSAERRVGKRPTNRRDAPSGVSSATTVRPDRELGRAHGDRG